ncbi:hypothetical protein [Flavobacterium cyanobacteriorum]|uniref:hypothetical protein n=1 Tax=Flavobacterium cyanobacteriorum TaxID=2022802 RepID=UPI00101ADAD7|nr:hypothetical protein [Flavobacterium cyanobacteriorum]
MSEPRLNRFLIACENSEIKAKELYKINLEVSKSFYPILNLFEIFIRNSFNYCVSDYFDNYDWIISEKDGFMSSPTLKPSKFFMKRCVIMAETSLSRKKVKLTSGKIIAEQSFGFWTSLFDVHHYKLIGGSVMHSFTNKPSHVNRSIISQRLNRIREFRNRIYHNEPICFNGNLIDFASAIDIKAEIYNVLEWMDSDLKIYVDEYNGIEPIINSLEKVTQ